VHLHAQALYAVILNFRFIMATYVCSLKTLVSQVTQPMRRNRSTPLPATQTKHFLEICMLDITRIKIGTCTMFIEYVLSITFVHEIELNQ